MKKSDLEKYPLINEELGNLLDYFSLMKDGGLTQAEFAKRKAECLYNLETKQYTLIPSLEVRTLKFANSLRKMKCLTQDEYEMVKRRIEQFSKEALQLEQTKKEKYERKRATNEILAWLWTICKILFIPFSVLWWLLEVLIYGRENVIKRDLMEDAMRRVKHDDD